MDLKVTERLFVYGTLKKGFSRNSVLSDSKYLGEFKTKPSFTMVDLGFFPGIIEKGNTSIIGELYVVSQKVLQLCDEMEGHPNFYFRKKIILENELEVWCYLLDKNQYEDKLKVQTGIWK